MGIIRTGPITIITTTGFIANTATISSAATAGSIMTVMKKKPIGTINRVYCQ